MSPDAPPQDEQPAPLLSIITVFWNHREQLDGFFAGLEDARRDLPFAIEVIAIDNASRDGTADAIAIERPWVRLIRNDDNKLFAPACNQGLEAARGEFLLLLNPDCEARATVLGAMVDFLRANPRTGALGVALVDADGKPQLSAYAEPGWRTYWSSHSLLSGPFSRRKLRAAARLARGRRQAARRVDWIIGACLMVPRAVHQSVGGLDPEYGMYSEDVDWCRRIRAAGRPVVQIPTMTMVHHQGSSSRRRPEFAFRRLYRSMLRYTLKHHGGIESRLLRASVLLDMMLRLPIHACQLDGARLRSVLWVMRLMAIGNERLPEPGQ